MRYLGPLFDRPEVRDLLSLLSMLSGSGSTLLRVGTFAEYQVGQPDLIKVLGAAQKLEVRATSMLSRLADVEGLSPRGLTGLRLLAAHLEEFSIRSTPWLVLMEYLFERSDYMGSLLKGDTPSADMRRVAVRQLIEALRSMPLTGNRPPIAGGLTRIRHMVLLADERELRRLPDELSEVDGVHLLTVHASKGLEFAAVHLPGLRKGSVPAANRAEKCPPPNGLVVDPVEVDAHAAEEECLFFVAMSRARSSLRFYRPASANGKNSNPSVFLEKLSLASPVMPGLARSNAKPGFPLLAEPQPPALTARDVEIYERCPRRFYYDRVMGLSGDRLDSTYLAAHRCLQQVMEVARTTSNPLSNEAIDEIFEKAWRESGLVDHVYEQPYRQLTETMLSSLRPLLARGLSTLEPIIVKVGAFNVEVRPDQIVVEGPGTTLRTIRSGRPTTTEQDRLGNSLLLQAAFQAHGPLSVVETFHLATGDTTPIDQSPTKLGNRLNTSAEIAGKISRGDFPPAASEWECPRCRHFFMCPAPAVSTP